MLLALPLPLYGAVDYYKRKDEVRDRYVDILLCLIESQLIDARPQLQLCKRAGGTVSNPIKTAAAITTFSLGSGESAQVWAFTCGCFERLVAGREHRGRSRLRAVARKHRNSPEEVVQAELARERLEEAARVALEVEARAKKMQLMALLPLLVIPVAGAENGIVF